MSHARWSDHVVNFARANPLNLTTTQLRSGKQTLPIISGLMGESRPRQLGVMVGALHRAELHAPVPWPGNAELETKYIELLQNEVETARQLATTSIVTDATRYYSCGQSKSVNFKTEFLGWL